VKAMNGSKVPGPNGLVASSWWIAFPLITLRRPRLVGWREILRVVEAMNGDTAPGPNGFSIAFFQACCDILEASLRAALMLRLSPSFQRLQGLSTSRIFAPLVLLRAFTKLLLKFW